MTTLVLPATNPEWARGLPLSVYRNARTGRFADVDTTNGGVTSRCETLTLVGTYDTALDVEHRDAGEPAPCATPLSEDSRRHAASIIEPPVVLRRRTLGRDVLLDLVPVSYDEDACGYRIEGYYMFGGNYAATGDSRLSDAARTLGVKPFHGALAVHDRVE